MCLDVECDISIFPNIFAVSYVIHIGSNVKFHLNGNCICDLKGVSKKKKVYSSKMIFFLLSSLINSFIFNS